MKRYKFQALVTLDRSGAGAATLLPDDRDQRFVVLGQHHQTHDGQVFSALVTNNNEPSLPMDDNHAIVKVTLLGEEPGDYFGIGDHFALWRGHSFGTGIVTRRLFV